MTKIPKNNQMLSNSLPTLPLVNANMMKHTYQSSNSSTNPLDCKVSKNSFQLEDPQVDPETINRLQLAFILNFCVKNKQRFKLPQLRLQDLYKNVLSDPEGLAYSDIIARLLRYRNSSNILSLIDIESKIENVDSCLDAYVNQKRSTHRQSIIKTLDQNYLVKLDVERRSSVLYDLILCLLDELPELNYSKSSDGPDGGQSWSDDPSSSASLIIKAGKDSNGCNYYYMDDLRLYRERLPSSAIGLPEWTLAVGASTEQWKFFIESLGSHSSSSEEADLRLFLQHDLFELVSQCILNDTWPSDTHQNDELSCIAIKAKEFRELNDLKGRLSGPQSAANTPKSVPNSTNSLSREASINNPQESLSGNVQNAPILTPNSSLTPNSNQSHSGDLNSDHNFTPSANATTNPTSNNSHIISSNNNNDDPIMNDSDLNNKGLLPNENIPPLVSVTAPTSNPSITSSTSSCSTTNINSNCNENWNNLTTPSTVSSFSGSLPPIMAQDHYFQQSNDHMTNNNNNMSLYRQKKNSGPYLVFTSQMANELAMERQKGNLIPINIFHKMHPLVKDYMANYNPTSSNLTLEQIEKRRSKMAQLEKIHNSLNKQQIQSSGGCLPTQQPKFSSSISNNQALKPDEDQLGPNRSMNSLMCPDNNARMNNAGYGNGMPSSTSTYSSGPMTNDSVYSSSKVRNTHQFPGQHQSMMNNGLPMSNVNNNSYQGQIPNHMNQNLQTNPPINYPIAPSSVPKGGPQPESHINFNPMSANVNTNIPMHLRTSQQQVDYFNTTGPSDFGNKRPNNGHMDTYMRQPSLHPGNSNNMYQGSGQYNFSDQSSSHVNSNAQFMNNLPMGNKGPPQVTMMGGDGNPAQREWKQLIIDYNKEKSIPNTPGMKRPSASNIPMIPTQHMNDPNAPWNQPPMGVLPRQNQPMMRQNMNMMTNGQYPPPMMMMPGGQYPPANKQSSNQMMPSSRMMMNGPQIEHPGMAPVPASSSTAPPTGTTSKKRKSTPKTSKAQQKLQQQQQQKQQQMAQQNMSSNPPPNVMMMTNHHHHPHHHPHHQQQQQQMNPHLHPQGPSNMLGNNPSLGGPANSSSPIFDPHSSVHHQNSQFNSNNNPNGAYIPSPNQPQHPHNFHPKSSQVPQHQSLPSQLCNTNGGSSSPNNQNMTQNITSASLASLQRLSQLSGSSNNNNGPLPPSLQTQMNKPDYPPSAAVGGPNSNFYPNSNNQQQAIINSGIVNPGGYMAQQQQQQVYNNTNIQITPKTPHTIQYMPVPPSNFSAQQ